MPSDAVRDFLSEQHAAAAGFRALTDNDLDCIGAAQILQIHAVAGRQILVDEQFAVAALFIGHAAVTGGCRGACNRCAAAKCFLGVAGQGAEAHA